MVRMDLGQVQAAIVEKRGIMDECWMELETAQTWEHVKEVSERLSEAGLEYKRLREMREKMLAGSLGRVNFLSIK